MPKSIVLGTRVSRPTARLLAQMSGCDSTETYIDTDILESCCLIFRYGNSSELSVPPPYSCPLDRAAEMAGKVVVNKAKAIANACNKKKARDILSSAGVNIPLTVQSESMVEFMRDSALAHENFEALYLPMVVRPEYHSKGREFYLVKKKAELEKFLRPGFYMSRLIDKADEYRVFVFNNTVLEISKKEPTSEKSDPIIRSRRRGWFFRWIPYSDFGEREVLKQARLAVKYLGLEFGAVDICTDRNGVAYVLEVNSAPGLVPRKVEKLISAVKSAYKNF